MVSSLASHEKTPTKNADITSKAKSKLADLVASLFVMPELLLFGYTVAQRQASSDNYAEIDESENVS